MSKAPRVLPHVRDEARAAAFAARAPLRPDGRPMDRNEQINRARAMRGPIGQRQIARFYRHGGAVWLEVVSEHDRTFVIQRPAGPDDMERWADEFASFTREEKP